jgi:triphosphoribosyl-dephospho-CoA synthase
MSANIPSVGLLAQLACIWECTARKPGNVHRDHDFEDVTYLDFLQSAAAIQPVLDAASEKTVGAIVLQGIEATRRVVNTNTNLGILLLLAPLAKAGNHNLEAAVGNVLAGLTVADARAVYTAIRLAQPGGMGRVENQDVGAEPTRSLGEIMDLAAERDLIARQYNNGFQEVFKVGVPALFDGIRLAGTME